MSLIKPGVGCIIPSRLNGNVAAMGASSIPANAILNADGTPRLNADGSYRLSSP